MAAELLHRWALAFRAFRRNLKAALPYVRRREYRIALRRHDELIRTMYALRSAHDAKTVVLQAPVQPASGELCLFVTHAPEPALKAHVVAHVEALLGAGIAVALVANRDDPQAPLEIPPALARRLHAVVSRENLGFDFAAWAQAMRLYCGAGVTRLYWVNDSIAGPLEPAAFARMIERLRAAEADVVGLTENPLPLRHVQSFFLAFGPAALASPALRGWIASALALPTKEQVIDVYETRFTWYLEQAGLRVATVFPPMTDDPHSANDVYHHWPALVRAGFPYVKTRVLLDFAADPRLRAMVPAEWLGR